MSKKVYCYLMHDDRLYKIGRSADVNARLNSMKTANPFIRLICYSNLVTEEYLHLKFKDKRKHLEWFDLSDEDVLYITGVMDGSIETGIEYDQEYFEVHENLSKYLTQIKSTAALKLIFALCSLANSKNNDIKLCDAVIIDICNNLKISRITFDRSIDILLLNNFISIFLPKPINIIKSGNVIKVIKLNPKFFRKVVNKDIVYL